VATGLYAELESVRRALNIRRGDDAADDDLISTAVTAASRAVDGLCNRPTGFGPDQAASPRVYRPEGPVLFVDDIASLDGLAVQTRPAGGTWAAYPDFDPVACMEPLNALDNHQPYTMINGNWAGAGLVQVTARWGWPDVPEIAQAAQLLAQRLFSRKNSPAGVAGWDAMGQAVRVGMSDPDVRMLIGPYVKGSLP